MDSSGTTQLAVYQLHVSLRGISPAIWRRVLMRSNSTITDLHYTIQLAMGWSDWHLNRFLIHVKEYGVYHDGGPLFSDSADEMLLSDFGFRAKERFLYEYDFGDDWQHDIRFELELPLEPQRTYPVCIGGRRTCPPEDCGGAWAFMARHNRRSNKDRFDRRAVNRRLKQYALGDDEWRWALS